MSNTDATANAREQFAEAVAQVADSETFAAWPRAERIDAGCAAILGQNGGERA